MTSIIIFFAFALVLTAIYRRLALSLEILAYPNSRSSHNQPIPTGAGVVLFLVFYLHSIYLFKLGHFREDTWLYVIYGTAPVLVMGVIDDYMGITPIIKLSGQMLFSAWLIALYFAGLGSLINILVMNVSAGYILIFFLLVWLFNVYNFMDGIDGMALCGSLLIFFTMGTLIYSEFGLNENVLILFFLGTACLGLLVFNFPPASIFMGDTGSLFIAYVTIAIAFKTVTEGHLSIWNWMIALGYFLSETTSTTVLRIFTTKDWYRSHRSHAYQNLARKWGNHRKMTLLAFVFYVAWIVPLAFLSRVLAEYSLLFFIMSMLPGIVLTYAYGPTSTTNAGTK